MNQIALALHAVAASLWIGGIFFAFMVLRPQSAQLEPPPRLTLWAGVFRRFFPWVWGFIGVLVITGYMDLFNRFGGLALHLPHLAAMQGIGWLMIALFAVLHLRLLPALLAGLKAGDLPAAAAAMQPIRTIMAINLGLGVLITLIGAGGPFPG